MKYALYYSGLCSLILMHVNGASVTQLITIPDRYVYNLNVPGEPTDPNDSLITVSSSNVIIDLNGSSLFQDFSNTVTGFNGVRILPNLNNVLIVNGNIANFTGYGVIVGDGCSAIGIDNVNIKECQAGAVLFDGSLTGSGISDISIKNSVIRSTTGFSASDAIGLKMTNVVGGIISGTLFGYNDANFAANGYGLYMNGGVGIQISDSFFSANGGLNSGVGAYLVNSSQCIFNNCQMNANFSRNIIPTAFGAGAYFQNCQSCRIEGCDVSDNFNFAGLGFGLRLDNCSNIFIHDTKIESNHGGILTSGIDCLDSTYSDIQNNIIRSNESSGVIYGIRLTGTNTAPFIANNDVINNLTTSTFENSYGIVDETLPSQAAIVSNRAYNQVINYQVNYVAGITLPVIDGSLTNTSIGMPSNVGGLFDNQSITI